MGAVTALATCPFSVTRPPSASAGPFRRRRSPWRRCAGDYIGAEPVGHCCLCCNIHPMSQCNQEGCGESARTRDMCRKHYMRWYRHGDPGAVLTAWDARGRAPLVERFWAKVAVGNSAECWVWQAYCRPDGYGQFQYSRANPRTAHRVAYELTYGPIPAGQEVCHRCDTPPCCNPDHLFLGSHHENMTDMADK